MKEPIMMSATWRTFSTAAEPWVQRWTSKLRRRAIMTPIVSRMATPIPNSSDTSDSTQAVVPRKPRAFTGADKRGFRPGKSSKSRLNFLQTG
jgi:hypothetical protein